MPLTQGRHALFGRRNGSFAGKGRLSVSLSGCGKSSLTGSLLAKGAVVFSSLGVSPFVGKLLAGGRGGLSGGWVALSTGRPLCGGILRPTPGGFSVVTARPLFGGRFTGTGVAQSTVAARLLMGGLTRIVGGWGWSTRGSSLVGPLLTANGGENLGLAGRLLAGALLKGLDDRSFSVAVHLVGGGKLTAFGLGRSGVTAGRLVVGSASFAPGWGWTVRGGLLIGPLFLANGREGLRLAGRLLAGATLEGMGDRSLSSVAHSISGGKVTAGCLGRSGTVAGLLAGALIHIAPNGVFTAVGRPLRGASFVGKSTNVVVVSARGLLGAKASRTSTGLSSYQGRLLARGGMVGGASWGLSATALSHLLSDPTINLALLLDLSTALNLPLDLLLDEPLTLERAGAFTGIL